MPLTSDLFKDNQQLQDCAIKDSAHIVADEPPKRRGVNNKGAHVALIHQAIRLLIPGAKLGLEEPNEIYGPLTAEVIRQFKADHDPPILNTALRQTTPDNVVGIKTIAALDEKLKRQRKQPDNNEPDRPVDKGPFKVVPFTESAPFAISRKMDERTEDDLDSTKRAPKISDQNALAKVGIAKQLPTAVLEGQMIVELSGGGQIGRDIARTFFNQNSVDEVPFKDGSGLSNALRNSTPFAPAHANLVKQISAHFKKSVDERKIVDYHELAASKGVIPPPMFAFSMSKDRRLKFAVGGLKGVEVFLSNFEVSATPRFWRGTIFYNYIDHFGINDTDLILDTSLHGSPGQAAMWVLQHDRHPGHFPFIVRIHVTMQVELERF